VGDSVRGVRFDPVAEPVASSALPAAERSVGAVTAQINDIFRYREREYAVAVFALSESRLILDALHNFREFRLGLVSSRGCHGTGLR
jgi:hypothetical protein